MRICLEKTENYSREAYLFQLNLFLQNLQNQFHDLGFEIKEEHEK